MLLAPTAWAQNLTPVPYQGSLTDSGSPFTGTADFRFTLLGSEDAGPQLSPVDVVTGVQVDDGLFRLEFEIDTSCVPDDGGWLLIEVDTGSGYTALSPRQRYRPSPQAVSAAGAKLLNLTSEIGAPAVVSLATTDGKSAALNNAPIISSFIATPTGGGVELFNSAQSFIPTNTGELRRVTVGASLIEPNLSLILQVYEGDQFDVFNDTLVASIDFDTGDPSSPGKITEDAITLDLGQLGGPILQRNQSYYFFISGLLNGPEVPWYEVFYSADSYPFGRSLVNNSGGPGFYDLAYFSVELAGADATPVTYVDRNSGDTSIGGDLSVDGGLSVQGPISVNGAGLNTSGISTAYGGGSVFSTAVTTLATASINPPGPGYIIAT